MMIYPTIIKKCLFLSLGNYFPFDLLLFESSLAAIASDKLFVAVVSACTLVLLLLLFGLHFKPYKYPLIKEIK
jgi:hypothetical protein